MNEEEHEHHAYVSWTAGEGLTALEAQPQPPEEQAQRPPPWVRWRWQLASLFALLALVLVAYAAGEATYHPESRIPRFPAEPHPGFYGVNGPLARELDAVEALFAGGAVTLEPHGEVFVIDFPRTLADRLFGERDERAIVFTAASDTGTHRFLVLEDGGGVAVHAIAVQPGAGNSGPDGLFLVLPPERFPALIAAIDAQIEALDALPRSTYAADDYNVFGPFARGRGEEVRARIEASTVMSHLAGELEAAAADVSVAGPAVLVLPAPPRGTINAVYVEALRLIQEPLWGDSSTDSLAHELTHAFFARVLADAPAVLEDVIAYLERVHPRLHGEVVGDLYERLDAAGRAEETVAFLTGAVASSQTRTFPTPRLLENPAQLSVSEPIFETDIDLLVELGLLPPCMALISPAAPGREVTFEYYEAVRETCGAG